MFLRKSKCFHLKFNCIYDWKSWLKPYVRNIEGHSCALPVLFYKTLCMNDEWIGYFRSFGFNLFSGIPEGFPSVYDPIPLPEDVLSDIPKFFPHMPLRYNTEWENFLEDQNLANTYPPLLLEDPWLIDFVPPENQPESVYDLTQLQQRVQIQANVVVENHPPVSVDQGEIGKILGFHYKDSYCVGTIVEVDSENDLVFVKKKNLRKNIIYF